MAENQDLLDFEDVQKEIVTSTDMAEEDRYGGEGEKDLMGGFDMGFTSATAPDANLLDFGEKNSDPVPETTVTQSTPPSAPETFAEPTPKPISEEKPAAPVVSPSPPEANLLKNVDPRVLELVYWRDVKKTGVVFGTMMFILLSLACCTLLSVIAYLSLAVLTVTFTFRVYKNVMQAVQKTNEGHPFKKLLDMEIELSDEVVKKAAENIARHVNCCVGELRRLYLVGDYVDSIKFGLLLWLLTYIGAWFNGMTLVILAVVSIFTLPKVYETYKVQIDSYINMARAQLNKIMTQITEKIPFPKKKAKTQ